MKILYDLNAGSYLGPAANPTVVLSRLCDVAQSMLYRHAGVGTLSGIRAACGEHQNSDSIRVAPLTRVCHRICTTRCMQRVSLMLVSGASQLVIVVRLSLS